jgi:hypothetical protein
MNWQELKREADKLSVSDRLKLVESIVRSIDRDVNPRPPIPEGTLTGLRGLLKKDDSSPSDREIEAMLQARREEKYH